MKRIALFPGSFDPFTKGHEDVVNRGAALLDEVVIGIGKNSQKKRFFPEEKMIALIEETFRDNPKITVRTFSGLTAAFAEEIGADFLLRGLRNTTDFEYENSIAQINRHIYPKLETILLITNPSLAYISSTLVRDIYRYGRDVSDYVPYSLPPLDV